MEYVSRCRACSSLVRRDQEWCTLCHADLRPPQRRPSPVAEPAADVEVHAVPVDPLEAPLALLLAERGPAEVDDIAAVPAAPLGKHARHADPQPAPAVRASAGVSALTGGANRPDDAELTAMIARLAAETSDPIAGAVSRLPESQGMRVVLALAVGCGVAAVLILATWLLGLVVG
jgi:hypothetical protein